MRDPRLRLPRSSTTRACARRSRSLFARRLFPRLAAVPARTSGLTWRERSPSRSSSHEIEASLRSAADEKEQRAGRLARCPIWPLLRGSGSVAARAETSGSARQLARSLQARGAVLVTDESEGPGVHFFSGVNSVGWPVAGGSERLRWARFDGRRSVDLVFARICAVVVIAAVDGAVVTG